MNVSNNSSTNESIVKSNEMMKRLKFLEDDRKRSFQNWQYDDDENCSVEKVIFMSLLGIIEGNRSFIFFSDGPSRILLQWS